MFVRNAKSFAIYIPVAFLFFPLVAFSGQTDKSSLPMNYLLNYLPMIRQAFLDALVNVSVYVLLVVITDVGASTYLICLWSLRST